MLAYKVAAAAKIPVAIVKRAVEMAAKFEAEKKKMKRSTPDPDRKLTFCDPVYEKNVHLFHSIVRSLDPRAESIEVWTTLLDNVPLPHEVPPLEYGQVDIKDIWAEMAL